MLAAALTAAAICCWPSRPEWRELRLRSWRPPVAASAPGRWHSIASRLGRFRHRRLALQHRSEHVRQVLAGLSCALDAGLAPADALAASRVARPAAHESDPLIEQAWDELEELARAGAPVGRAWVELGQRLQVPVAVQVGRAWTLSERLGSPLTAAVRTTVEAHEASTRLDRAFAAQSAGPRATVQVLTALPVLGLLLMPVLGINPARAYPLPVVLVSVLPGLALMAAGRWWSRLLVGRALRPPRLR